MIVFKIPARALTDESEEGSALMPEAGDEVMLKSADVRVVSIDGEEATVELVAANGEAPQVNQAVAPEMEAADDEEVDEAEILKALKAEDERRGY